MTGAVERIVFHNDDSGFMVARFQIADAPVRGDTVITIVGTLPTVRAGEMLRLTGEWHVHPVHGKNFHVTAFEPELPQTADGIERYLASGTIRGVGPVTATRIVECFGDATMTVIDQEPDLLRQVAGVSEKRLTVIKAAWNEQKHIRGIMMFLQQHDMSVAMAARLYAAYGHEAAELIQQDPFRMVQEIHGIGFKTADTLARRLGMPLHSTSRYMAGLRHILSEAADDGHVFLERVDLVERAGNLLDAPVVALEPALLEMLRREIGVMEGDRVYLGAFHRAEAGAARFLEIISTTPSSLTLGHSIDARALTAEAGAEQGLELADRQADAVAQALMHKVSILTGGPGTGKTSTLRTIIAVLEHLDVTYCLCAPTGRAAKRVAETTGRLASTIHRLLEFQPASNSFNYDNVRPLPYDFVIVDEVSMLDIVLFYHLLKAVPPESHLLLVGDADQLPSVGPGNVMRDLIASHAVPTVQLTELFRQVRGSQIILASHSVNRGVVPEIANAADHDLFFVRAEQEPQALDAIKRLVKERIPRRYGLDPIDDVQVISPMHVGQIGVASLNQELQSVLNPHVAGAPELRRGERVFREGDKVMQIRNNYDKDVFNGDVGKVVEIDPDEGACVVAYPAPGGSNDVIYEANDLEELSLAYALSVHKAQGSEFPCIVLPLLTRHYMLLQRNVLYTAMTRARQLCILVGSQRALTIAVQSNHRQARNTALASRLADNQRDEAL
ncbi:MAG: ATP-dependent RecD-like DNA helicase [Chloroflexota bacterium]